MYTAPTNWETIFGGAHKTEYKLVIGGVEYTEDYIQEPPRLTRPLMDVPAIGKVCSATLVATVIERADVTIETAAEVYFYCRLKNNTTQTDWVPLGRFLVSSRSKGEGVITLTCRDFMLKTGRTYFDKTSFTEWPQSYADVAADIAQIIGVELDPRNSFPTGEAFMVDAWGDDTLMSEVLAGIGAGSAGNWVMTGDGKLRLVPFIKTAIQSSEGDIVSIKSISGQHYVWSPNGPVSLVYRAVGSTRSDAGDIVTIEGFDGRKHYVWSPDGPVSVEWEAVGAPDVDIGKSYKTLSLLEQGALHVGQVILIAQEDVEYAAGDAEDTTGIVLEATCPFATQETANAVFNRLSGEAGWYLPISVIGAYLDPLLELGDLITVTERNGSVRYVTLNSLDTTCNIGFQTDITSGYDAETEDEYPYETAREIQARRAVKTSSKYYGNSITHTEGFKSEHESGAYALFNAQEIKFVDENGKACLYYDTTTHTFKLAGYARFTDLETQGETVINGGNVTVGTIRDAAGKNSWNLATGAFVITNGSINITTSSETYDQIVLTYGNYRSTVKAGGFVFHYKNGDNWIQRSTLDVDGVSYYDYAGNRIARLGTNGPTTTSTGSGVLACYAFNDSYFAGLSVHTGTDDTANGAYSAYFTKNGLYVNRGTGSGFFQAIDLTSRDYESALLLRRSNGGSGARLSSGNSNDASSLSLYETSGTPRISLSGTGVMSLYNSDGAITTYITPGSASFFDDQSKVRATIGAAGVSVRNNGGSTRVTAGLSSSDNGLLTLYGSDNAKRTEISALNIYQYNASGTQTMRLDGTNGRIYPLGASDYIHDFIIAEGYTSPWYWRKWYSGYAEAWARVAHTMSFSQAWGSVYTADIAPEAYPFSFRDGTQPIEQVSAVGAKSGTDNSCWICNYGGQTGPTHLQTGKYQAIRPVSGSATIRIAYYVRGLL